MSKPSTSMVGAIKPQTYHKSKQMRMSMNLVSLSKGPQYKQDAHSGNKSVIGLRTSKQRPKLASIEDNSVRQSQRTNDFWNLSKDSVNQLDLKTRIYSQPDNEYQGKSGNNCFYLLML
jgi:hypothetical protein